MSRLTVRRAEGDPTVSITVEAPDLQSALAILRGLVEHLDPEALERFAALPQEEQQRIVRNAAREVLGADRCSYVDCTRRRLPGKDRCFWHNRDVHPSGAEVEVEKLEVERWNREHPIGTRVRYWPGFREGEGRGPARTRTEASIVGGTAVVFVEGFSSCIALSHVEVVS